MNLESISQYYHNYTTVGKEHNYELRSKVAVFFQHVRHKTTRIHALVLSEVILDQTVCQIENEMCDI